MDEKPKTIYFTDDSNTGMVYPEMPDDVPCDEFAETGAVIVMLFASLFILAVIAIIFCIMYFK